MIGNDIVDLHQSRLESNWQRMGWQSKLFSEKEQHYLSQSCEKEKICWLLWSMKEAAYKIVNRALKKTFFAPAKFDCTVLSLSEDAASGTVLFQEIYYPAKSIICQDFIHTIAYDPCNKVESPHLMIASTNTEIQLQKHLVFHKDADGIPFVFNNISQETQAASLSHHGRYQALVF
jgi:phosphopantetheinyl transferase (holo-ACP synthase)